jgi:hypothetical protein
MNFSKKNVLLSLVVLSLVNTFSFSQGTRYNPATGTLTNSAGQPTSIQGSARPITTAVPFLNIAPDSRAGAMGDAGVATTPDVYSSQWNPAKYAFAQKDYGLSISYTPWLRKLVDDMSISYLSGYTKLRKEDAVYVSMTYFNLGKIDFTDNSGNKYLEFNPREYAGTVGYSRILSDNMSVAVGLKFIYSNLAGNFTSPGGGTESKPAKGFGGDIGLYWNKEFVSGTKNSRFAWGVAITNFGSKISYTNNNRNDFIPTNLRIGAAYTLELDLYNKLTFTTDANKLMVPTPPVYYQASNGTDSTNAGNKVIYKGKDPDRPLFQGVLGSFTDAPGGIQEELKEITMSYGMEYLYADIFALRVGHFRENVLKGNRKFFTVGLGLKFYEGKAGIDFSYLVAGRQNNPLEGTLRFSLYMELEKQRGKETESITE